MSTVNIYLLWILPRVFEWNINSCWKRIKYDSSEVKLFVRHRDICKVKFIIQHHFPPLGYFSHRKKKTFISFNMHAMCFHTWWICWWCKIDEWEIFRCLMQFEDSVMCQRSECEKNCNAIDEILIFNVNANVRADISFHCYSQSFYVNILW